MSLDMAALNTYEIILPDRYDGAVEFRIKMTDPETSETKELTVHRQPLSSWNFDQWNFPLRVEAAGDPSSDSYLVGNRDYKVIGAFVPKQRLGSYYFSKNEQTNEARFSFTTRPQYRYSNFTLKSLDIRSTQSLDRSWNELTSALHYIIKAKNQVLYEGITEPGGESIDLQSYAIDIPREGISVHVIAYNNKVKMLGNIAVSVRLSEEF